MRNLGIELENNSITPMEDVVNLSMFVFGHSQSVAFENMVKVHKKGSALVVVFPENRQAEIQSRLESFIGRMEKPVVYRVVDASSDRPDLEVDFDRLLTWEGFQEKELAAKHKRRLWYTIAAIALLALAPVILLRLI